MKLFCNCCDGIYNSFDVHFTSACDNKCAHCVDTHYSGFGLVKPNVGAIVETILKNIDNPKSNIHILTVTCLDENTSYDISLEKKHFASTLEENLKYYIKEELYEKCTQIVEVINKLKNK